MDQGMVIDLAQDALWTIIVVSGPMLVLALVIGLMVSVFQTVTSIQEPTLAFVPKILAVFAGVLVFGPWMLRTLMEFIITLYTNFSYYIG